ncbi:MAG: filamentous hemagglutinin N-terminal domain-containing protein [Sulfuritalea sp.]|nr:filamentous hemagglutinin N-terminal domain-containing protein [Sulfuritalea sp.]
MNRDTYRLVFNQERGAWMAAAEFVRGQLKGGRRALRARRRGLALALLAAVALDAAAAPRLPAGTVPVPVNAGGAGFVSSGAASYANPVATLTGKALTITQTSPKAVLNWNSFNVAAGSSVNFSHPSASAATLNRIGSADPSVIQGVINSTARDTGGVGGAVYLINRNGILFDRGVQVNVGGLVASALVDRRRPLRERPLLDRRRIGLLLLERRSCRVFELLRPGGAWRRDTHAGRRHRAVVRPQGYQRGAHRYQ